jgi:hypothetical protein
LKKYEAMGFLEIQQREWDNWFKPTELFLKFFK